jgi:class 3 adenylate cyclase
MNAGAVADLGLALETVGHDGDRTALADVGTGFEASIVLSLMLTVGAEEPCPLPDDPALAQVAVAMRDAGYWAFIVDPAWRVVYVTDDWRLAAGGNVEMVALPLGVHYTGSEFLGALERRLGPVVFESARQAMVGLGPLMLADTPGGPEELRKLLDPRIQDLVDALGTSERVVATSYAYDGPVFAGRRVTTVAAAVRVRDCDGRFAGTVLMPKPEANVSVFAAMTALGDLRHLNRMQGVAKAGRRAAAMLFADLESSSQLARGLSTASYFSLARRIVRAADRCVVDNGGLVGRHAGDGVVAFFLAETAGSESAAARGCIQAAHDLRAALSDVAARSDLDRESLDIRVGLHWGATLYVGQIMTSGRMEVTALGDEVNEGARIEACATGGRTLASKDLLERLGPDDSGALGLIPEHVTYTPLAQLPTATEKARRDAPTIAVCEI